MKKLLDIMNLKLLESKHIIMLIITSERVCIAFPVRGFILKSRVKYDFFSRSLKSDKIK